MSEVNEMRRSTAAGRAMMLAAAILWGMAGICVKSITWGPMSQIAARSLLSFLILAAFKRSMKLRFSKQNILGALAMTATGILYVTAITMSTAGTAIVLQYIAPILVLLYYVIFRHRRPTLAEILISALVFVGVFLSFMDDLDMTHVIGNILAILSGFAFAAQIVIMSGSDNDSSDSLMISCLISMVIALPFMLTDKGLSFDSKNIFWVLMLGIFQYGMANVLFGYGIKKVNTIEGSLILTIEPVFNPIPVALLGIEVMGTKAIIGAVIVITGVTVYGLLPVITARLRKRRGIADAGPSQS